MVTLLSSLGTPYHFLELIVKTIIILWFIESHSQRNKLFLLLQVKFILLHDQCIFKVGLLKLIFLKLDVVIEPFGKITFSILAGWYMRLYVTNLSRPVTGTI